MKVGSRSLIGQVRLDRAVMHRVVSQEVQRSHCESSEMIGERIGLGPLVDPVGLALFGAERVSFSLRGFTNTSSLIEEPASAMNWRYRARSRLAKLWTSICGLKKTCSVTSS